MSVGSKWGGVSREAGQIQRRTRHVRTQLHKCPSLGDELAAAEELWSVWNECRAPNWDGYGAQPVSRATYLKAFEFLKSLPLNCPPPSFGAEPDGELTVEWYREPKRVLSISINELGDLSYAALLGPGPRRAYGSEVFWGEVPERILDLIREVVSK